LVDKKGRAMNGYVGNPVLYLLMRNDLPSLNPGKLAAQAAHASNQFVGELMNNMIHPNDDFIRDAVRLNAMYTTWAQEANNFGTTIVLGATLEQINEALVVAALHGYPNVIAGRVVDPTYPASIPYELGKYFMENEDCLGRGLVFSKDDEKKTAFMLRKETTGSYFFGDKGDTLLQSILGNFELYP
jgi:hypothetical protein